MATPALKQHSAAKSQGADSQCRGTVNDIFLKLAESKGLQLLTVTAAFAKKPITERRPKNSNNVPAKPRIRVSPILPLHPRPGR